LQPYHPAHMPCIAVPDRVTEVPSVCAMVLGAPGFTLVWGG
jgi:hypothetical protein